MRRLKQLKQSLTNKLTVLATLDDELIGLVEDDDLEAEVEQADETREKIDLAILTIEDALADYQGGTRQSRLQLISTKWGGWAA